MSREQLQAVYLEWVNDWLTIDRFAEHYGLHKDEAIMLIKLAQSCNQYAHPDE